MATSVSVTRLGVNIAVVRATVISAATAAAEAVTVNHNLGFSPDRVNPILRSVVSSPSSEPVLTASSWGPSTALVNLVAGLGERIVVADIFVERIHSVVR